MKGALIILGILLIVTIIVLLIVATLKVSLPKKLRIRKVGRETYIIQGRRFFIWFTMDSTVRMGNYSMAIDTKYYSIEAADRAVKSIISFIQNHKDDKVQETIKTYNLP